MSSLSRKLTRRASVALIVLTAICLLLTTDVSAQDTIQPGRTEVFPDAMLAYRLGNYYFVKGDYVRAIEYLSEAIALVPPPAFSLDPGYADMYWILGEALEASERYGEALTSYQTFLALVGDQAPLWTVEKVMLLAARYGAMAALPANT